MILCQLIYVQLIIHSISTPANWSQNPYRIIIVDHRKGLRLSPGAFRSTDTGPGDHYADHRLMKIETLFWFWPQPILGILLTIVITLMLYQHFGLCPCFRPALLVVFPAVSVLMPSWFQRLPSSECPVHWWTIEADGRFLASHASDKGKWVLIEVFTFSNAILVDSLLLQSVLAIC